MSRVLTSRRGAWVSLVVGILVLVGIIGAFGRATMSPAGQGGPPDSESTRVAALVEEFPDADDRTLLVVASTLDGETLSADPSE